MRSIRLDELLKRCDPLCTRISGFLAALRCRCCDRGCWPRYRRHRSRYRRRPNPRASSSASQRSAIRSSSSTSRPRCRPGAGRSWNRPECLPGDASDPPPQALHRDPHAERTADRGRQLNGARGGRSAADPRPKHLRQVQQMAVGGQSDFAGADAFAGSMVDFTATISWFNVLHSAEMGQSEQPVDLASCATSALGSPRRLSADFQRAGESSIHQRCRDHAREHGSARRACGGLTKLDLASAETARPSARAPICSLAPGRYTLAGCRAF